MTAKEIAVTAWNDLRPGDRIVRRTDWSNGTALVVERGVPQPGTTGTATALRTSNVHGFCHLAGPDISGTFAFTSDEGVTIPWSDVTDFVPDAPDPTQWVPMATAEETEVEANRLRGRLDLRTVERDHMKERWEGAKAELDLARADLSDAQDAYEAAYRAAAPDLDMEDRTEPLAVVVERRRKKADEPRPLPTRDELAVLLGDHFVKASRNLGQYRSEQECDCGATWVTDGHSPERHPTIHTHLADVALALLRGESR